MAGAIARTARTTRSPRPTLPNWRRLLATIRTRWSQTHGRYVGLPDGQMGNSEVGHMNIGAGRIVYQDLTRIDAAIADGSFFDNPALAGACDCGEARAAATLHVFGLLSPGGVHSHEDHIFAMLDLAARRGVPRIAVHAFLDGRDTPPRSARASLEKLEAKCASIPGNACIASVSGRYFAMDRDKRWDRVKLAYDAIVDGESPNSRADSARRRSTLPTRAARTTSSSSRPSSAHGAARRRWRCGRVHELPRRPRARAHRMRSSMPILPASRGAHDRACRRSSRLTDYEKGLAVTAIAYRRAIDARTRSANILPSLGLTQLRIAETEKYAHVTFFFSGGREDAVRRRGTHPGAKPARRDLRSASRR